MIVDILNLSPILLLTKVMKGYWKNEKATRETVDEDGWLHTGDIAYYDKENYFYIVDRLKELIKVKGFQVSLVLVKIFTVERVRDKHVLILFYK